MLTIARRRRLAAILIAAAAGLIALVHRPATAHELSPAIVAATISQSGEAELSVAMNLEAYLAGVGPQHSDTTQSPQAATYESLRSEEPEVLATAFRQVEQDFAAGLGIAADGERVALRVEDVTIPPIGDTALARTSTVLLRGRLPSDARSVTWQVDPRFGATVIRLSRAGASAPFYAAYQRAGEATPPVTLEGATRQDQPMGFVRFTAIGFQHIVPSGPDHILFVVGLFLLSPLIRPLLAQVTGFTVAHSVSLALGAYGAIRVAPAIVEPLIAASIAFVAVENLFTNRLSRWRPVIVFGFGLLHGLGFAGVLDEVGLPRSQFVSALLGFNLGVELGQLAVLVACFLVVGLWFRHRDWYRTVITMPASAALALVATYWFVERVT